MPGILAAHVGASLLLVPGESDSGRRRNCSLATSPSWLAHDLPRDLQLEQIRAPGIKSQRIFRRRPNVDSQMRTGWDARAVEHGGQELTLCAAVRAFAHARSLRRPAHHVE